MWNHLPVFLKVSAGPCSKMECDWIVWGLSLRLRSLCLSSLSLLSFFGAVRGSSFNLRERKGFSRLNAELNVADSYFHTDTYSSLLLRMEWTFGTNVFCRNKNIIQVSILNWCLLYTSTCWFPCCIRTSFHKVLCSNPAFGLCSVSLLSKAHKPHLCLDFYHFE